jgi:radical SAM protein with 4Fe4S-binding SPASM domain
MKPPSHVLLILTYRCNLRCPYCVVFNPVRYWRPDEKVLIPPALAREEMTTEQIMKRVIPQCEKAGVDVIALTGGEVLLRKDSKEIFRALGDSSLKWCIDSNLSFCTDEVSEAIINASCDTVFASMDGPPEVHNKLRASPRAYKGFSEGLERLLRARSEAVESKTSIVLNCVVQAGNESATPDVVRIAAEYGVDGVSFQLLSKLDYGEEFKADIAAQALGEARRLGNDLGIPVSVFPVPQPTAADLTSWFSSPPSTAFFRGCSYIYSSLRIDPSGNVIPCVEHRIGNILEDDLLGIWRGSVYDSFRQQIMTTPIKACLRCCNMDAQQGDNPGIETLRQADRN